MKAILLLRMIVIGIAFFIIRQLAKNKVYFLQLAVK